MPYHLLPGIFCPCRCSRSRPFLALSLLDFQDFFDVFLLLWKTLLLPDSHWCYGYYSIPSWQTFSCSIMAWRLSSSLRFLDITELFPTHLNVKWENDNKRPFLDTLVYRFADHFCFVNRKTMHSGMYIHFSLHLFHVKRGVSTSLFLCALKICDPQYLHGNVKFLHRSLSELGSPCHVFGVAHICKYINDTWDGPIGVGVVGMEGSWLMNLL